MKNLFTIICFVSFIGSTFADQNLWTNITGQQIDAPGEKLSAPSNAKTYQLDLTGMGLLLNNVPHENFIKARNSNFIISLPLSDGSFQRFRIVQYNVMEQPLADKYQGIRTFLGEGIDNPYASVRLDVTYAGFHALIFKPDGDVYIDPVSMGTTDYYNVYKRIDMRRANQNFCCEIVEHPNSHDHLNNNQSQLNIGENLRTFRLALACTGEYAARFGATVPTVLAEMNTAMNRINGVYEKDIAVRMTIIANNNLIIFLNASTDPYTNNNGGAMLGQNQTTCDNIIGNANYDMGHVFSTGGGGIAGLGVICRTGQKAQGVTGLSNPVGDPFYIDYVAHEMGHQFGANHTFNSISGGCSGNRNGGTAVEPGSASTIMGYAGLCGSDNLQNFSDPYFVVISINEMRQYITTGQGTCAVITATGNSDPVVTVPVANYTIPKSTPFALTGSAVDPDNDPLVYCWEGINTGPAGQWNNPIGNAAIFRSFNPVPTGFRTFPKLANLLNNSTTVGEILPSYGRSLDFRLTVRDNKLGGGGVGIGSMNTIVVNNDAGPFLVTFPNTNVTIGGAQTVTWDVANTNVAPVLCAVVNILLSTDGGNTWPTTLSTATLNDGSESVTLPDVDNTTARIKVESVGNIFFDISNANFTIVSTIGIHNNQNGTPIEFALEQNFPNPFNPITLITYALPKRAEVTLKVYDIQGRLVSTILDNETKTEGYYNIEFDATNLPSGLYFYTINAGDYKMTKKMILIK